MVEHHRREHLASDKQNDEGRSPELWDKEDGKADEDRAKQTATIRPPRDAPAAATEGMGSRRASASSAMQATPTK